MLVSTVIPTYNRAKDVVLAIESALAQTYPHQEILVCDDGSTDGTVAEVDKVAAADPRVVLVRHDINRGKGAAIRTALDAATGDYVLIQDADLEYEVDDYPALLRPLIDGAEVVYGSRFAANPHPEGMRRSNYLANRVLTTTANLLYGVHITDEATCFKVFRTELLRELDLECTGFEFCPEVTAKLGLRKLAIAEVPIQYRARTNAEGKKVRWTDGFEAMWVLLRHRLRRR